MNRMHKKFLPAYLVALLLLPSFTSFSLEQAKQKKAPAAQQQPEQEDPYTEEEWDAYDKAVKEPDTDKRGTALMAFMDKYPKSKLQEHIVGAYQTLLYEHEKNQRYAKLGPLAEQWLKYYPGDLPSIAAVAESARKLNQDQKFIEYGQKWFAAKPTANIAYFLAEAFKRTGDQARYLEWTEKCFSYYPENFALRMVFVQKYSDEKNFAKAAEYAQLALKSLDIAKKPDTTSEAEWKKVTTELRRSNHYLIGIHLYDKDKFAEAIQSMEKALSYDKNFDWAYYYIGRSLWSMGKVEPEALVAFAKAELLKGEAAKQSKEHLEKLYRANHNDTLVGVEKNIYKLAREELRNGSN
jgi:hypothetical protein